MHLVVTSMIKLDPPSYKETEKILKQFDCTPAIISLVDMHKRFCVTKEEFEKMYKTNEKSQEREDLSIGEDLETFIENIKNGKMNKGRVHQKPNSS